jgi:aubergine
MAQKKFDFIGIGRGRGRGSSFSDSWSPPRDQFEMLSTEDQTEKKDNDWLKVTRPKRIESKEGSRGAQIDLRANYFRLENTPEFKFTLYRVDFDPEVDELSVRKRLVNELKPQLGAYVFDGQNMIYLTHKLPQEKIRLVCHDGFTRLIARSTGQEINATDRMALQIYNLILRRTIGSLKLEQIGRNMYDPHASVKISEHNLELWPGYITSIRHHENNNMLVACEVSHKVMRKETVLDLMKSIIKEKGSGDWQEEFKKEILGRTVLTG